MRIWPGKCGSVRKRHKQKPTCGSKDCGTQPELESFPRLREILCRQFEWCWMALLFLAIWAPEVPAAYSPADYIHPDQVQTGSLLIRMKNGYRVATRMNTV
ncbi:MAG: hypothetical protein VYD01_02495, partial [Pseudomonadota bacterium]|nr:hypothetical protein [Pseudomonadota bacterium]